MTPQRNLESADARSSARRARSSAPYGGLAYLGPFYGVPSIGFYSAESELMPAHLDIGWRLGRLIGTPVTLLDTRVAGMLRTLFSTTERGEADAADARLEAAVHS